MLSVGSNVLVMSTDELEMSYGIGWRAFKCDRRSSKQNTTHTRATVLVMAVKCLVYDYCTQKTPSTKDSVFNCSDKNLYHNHIDKSFPPLSSCAKSEQILQINSFCKFILNYQHYIFFQMATQRLYIDK